MRGIINLKGLKHLNELLGDRFVRRIILYIDDESVSCG